MSVTYSDCWKELIEINASTSIFIEEFYQNSNLLSVEIYSEISQAMLELLGIETFVFVIIERLEHLGESSDGQRSSGSESLSYVSHQSCTIVGQLLWGSHWLSGRWIESSQNLPDVLIATWFLLQVNHCFTNSLVGKLLRFLQSSSFLSRDFEFHAVLISIVDLVTWKEFFGGTMLDNQLMVGLNWSSNEWGSISVLRNNSPHGVVNVLCGKAHLQVSWESSEDLRRALGGVKIQWLVEDVWVSDKSYLFSISDNIISFFVINLLKG